MNSNKERESITFLKQLGDKYGNSDFVDFVLKEMKRQEKKDKKKKMLVKKELDGNILVGCENTLNKM